MHYILRHKNIDVLNSYIPFKNITSIYKYVAGKYYLSLPHNNCQLALFVINYFKNTIVLTDALILFVSQRHKQLIPLHKCPTFSFNPLK